MWHGYATKLESVLTGVTPASLPTTAWERIGRRFLGRGPGDANEAADFVVGVALALVLSRAGFILEEAIPARPTPWSAWASASRCSASAND